MYGIFRSFFVNNLRTIESQTTPGLVLQKLYFQPGVNVDLAVAQTVSATNSIRAFLPPCSRRSSCSIKRVVRIGAAIVAVVRQADRERAYDYGVYRVRQQLRPSPHDAAAPYGGKIRQVMVDIDSTRLAGLGLTPLDVSNAINVQNLTLPAGTTKFGPTQYDLRMNGMPDIAAQLNQVP
jgi:multidrug efflux pump subunit AcrB